MGGNALKCPTTRLDADAYFDLAQRLARDVSERFGVRTHVVRAYRNKLDFGDLDLIVERAGGLEGELDLPASRDRPNAPVPDTEVIQTLRDYAQQYHSRDVFRERNSPVFTFEHRHGALDETGFQVDLILAQPQDFKSTCDYFAYNDLGNLAGRIADAMGCKYGFDGLHMKIADGTQHLETLCLTKDTSAIHALLDLDHARFEAGFDSMEEVFDFLVASRFFHPHLYKREGASYKERRRDLKRVNYGAFMERCEQMEADEYEPITPEVAMAHVVEHFPELPGRIEQVMSNEARRRDLVSWFNGRNLSEWTGVSGKDLGVLINRLREDAGDEATLTQWGPDEVKRRAVEIASAHKGPSKGPGIP